MSTFFASSKSAGTTVEVDFGDKKCPKKFAIGYWSIRGLGAPLRMMLCAAKVPFTIFLYDCVEKDGGGWNSDYFASKEACIEENGQPLWNLPYCVDRENKRVICQTNAIFAYLGRACGMFGTNAIETSECEQLLCELYDLRDAMTDFCYGENSDVTVPLNTAKTILKKLESWLGLQAKKQIGSSSKVVHLVGESYTAPDFHLYELLDQFEALASSTNDDIYSGFPRLKEFKEGFATLE